MKKMSVLTALALAAALLAGCASAAGSKAPAYDKAQLERSEYNGAELTEDIRITIEGDAAGQEELPLQYSNLTEVDYNFTALQRLEVELDGDWYLVPDAQDFVTMQLYTLPAQTQVEDSFRFEGRYDPLPAGNYRILKTFSDPNGNSLTAAALFTVV